MQRIRQSVNRSTDSLLERKIIAHHERKWNAVDKFRLTAQILFNIVFNIVKDWQRIADLIISFGSDMCMYHVKKIIGIMIIRRIESITNREQRSVCADEFFINDIFINAVPLSDELNICNYRNSFGSIFNDIIPENRRGVNGCGSRLLPAADAGSFPTKSKK